MTFLGILAWTLMLLVLGTNGCSKTQKFPKVVKQTLPPLYQMQIDRQLTLNPADEGSGLEFRVVMRSALLLPRVLLEMTLGRPHRNSKTETVLITSQHTINLGLGLRRRHRGMMVDSSSTNPTATTIRVQLRFHPAVARFRQLMVSLWLAEPATPWTTTRLAQYNTSSAARYVLLKQDLVETATPFPMTVSPSTTSSIPVEMLLVYGLPALLALLGVGVISTITILIWLNSRCHKTNHTSSNTTIQMPQVMVNTDLYTGTPNTHASPTPALHPAINYAYNHYPPIGSPFHINNAVGQHPVNNYVCYSPATGSTHINNAAGQQPVNNYVCYSPVTGSTHINNAAGQQPVNNYVCYSPATGSTYINNAAGQQPVNNYVCYSPATGSTCINKASVLQQTNNDYTKTKPIPKPATNNAESNSEVDVHKLVLGQNNQGQPCVIVKETGHILRLGRNSDCTVFVEHPISGQQLRLRKEHNSNIFYCNLRGRRLEIECDKTAMLKLASGLECEQKTTPSMTIEEEYVEKRQM